MDWHAKSVPDVLKNLGSSKDGLTEEDVVALAERKVEMMKLEAKEEDLLKMEELLSI